MVSPARAIGAWKSAPGQPTGRKTDRSRCPASRARTPLPVALDDDVDRGPRLVDRARELGMEVRAVELRVRVPERVPRLEVGVGQPVERNDLNGHGVSVPSPAFASELPVTPRGVIALPHVTVDRG